MRALITGITGFAGQYLAEHLVDCGDEVVGSTYLDPWSRDVAEAVRRNVPLVEWNLTEPLPAAARVQVERLAIDWIFHLAAISVPGDCGGVEPSPLATAVNVDGTRAVLALAHVARPAAARAGDQQLARICAGSSADHPRVAEDAPLGPTGAYGITKLRCEQLCREAVSRGLDVIVARAFQHAGPRQLAKFMLPEWI